MKAVYSANDEERRCIVNRLATAFAHEPNIAFAYLYGSFVEADAFHDVDIGVYVSRHDPGQDPLYVLDLIQPLAGLVPFPIDVRILNDAPVSFLYHVLKGRPIHIQDDEVLTNLMEQTVRQYLDMAPLLRQSAREAFAG
ncbi:MAG TPA: nucleotidyltransferase domain-containing protein [Nitrospiraceae bacterium]|nr:nucleotidyltransferase domain-containing protein [Nitrospiraceae bacterium]